MKNHSVVFFILGSIILILTWSIFGAWVTLLGRSWIWLGVAFLYSFFIAPSFYYSRGFFFLLPYFFIVFLNYMVGDSYFDSVIKTLMEFFVMAVPASCSYFYLSNENRRAQAVFLIINFILLVFVSAATFVIDQAQPGIVREIQSYINVGVRPPMAILERYGLSDYYLPHAIPVLIPALVMVIRSKDSTRLRRLCFIILLSASVVLTFVSGATTSFIYALFIVVISLVVFPGGFKENRLSIIVLFILFLIFLNNATIVYFIDLLDSLVGGSETLHERFNDIKDSILYNSVEGDVGNRMDLYSLSLGAFFNNILIGQNSGIGGHSVLLDRLGALGLIGFVPYFLFIFYQFKYIISHINSQYRIYYFLSIIAGIAMLGTKNMSNWQMWCALFILSPLIINHFSSSTQNKKIKL